MSRAYYLEQLADYRPHERSQILALATRRLSPLKRVALNLTKLALLLPPFFALAQLDWLAFIGWTVSCTLAYVFGFRTLQFHWIKPQLQVAKQQFQKST